MKSYIKHLFAFIAALSLSTLPAFSQSKAAADEAYAKERFHDALSIYQQLLPKGESADVYYNLANCYYRLDSIAPAILWYERALMLSPGDGDIRFNLRLARSKTIDKILPEEELFFVRWYRSLLNTMSVGGWQILTLCLFAAMLVAFGCFFLSDAVRLRKLGFYGGFALLLLVLMGNVMVWQQKKNLREHTRAILMQQAVTVKSTPSDNGTDLFLLHSGTSMQILDNSMPEWYQIRLSDGKEGWIPAKTVEMI